MSVLTRKNRSSQFQVLAEGTVGTKTNFLRQHHRLGTKPVVAAGLEEKPWSLEKVVGNDRSLLAAKEETGESQSFGSGSPGDQRPFSRPVIADGNRLGSRNFSGKGQTAAANQAQELRGDFIQEAS